MPDGDFSDPADVLVIFQRWEYGARMVTEMREPTFWVLTVLAAGRRHGYALMQEARDLSCGRVDLKVATLYAALDRLEKEGLVAVDGDETVDGRVRRYFTLTDAGADKLAVEIARLESNARQAASQLRVGSRVRAIGSTS
jgi:DNA-binding PadR family transcriptional regulator